MILALAFVAMVALVAATVRFAGLAAESELFGGPVATPPSRRQIVECPAGTIQLSYYDNRNTRARQTLLMIHGWMDTKRAWRYVWPHLSERFHLVALDLPGSGESDAPDWAFVDRARGLYAAELLAEVVDAFVRRQQEPGFEGRPLLRGKLIVVGHSLGGAVLLSLLTGAAGSADWVRRAVLLDALEASTPSLPMAYYDSQLFGATPSPLVAMGNWTFVGSAWSRAVMERIFLDPAKVPREFLAAIIQDMRAPRRVACQQRILAAMLPQTEANRPDWQHRRRLLAGLSRIRKPVLIVWGAQDTLTPLAHGDLLARRIPGAGYLVIDDCGHAPQLEQPAVTAAVLARFAARPALLAVGGARLPGVTIEQRPGLLHRPGRGISRKGG